MTRILTPREAISIIPGWDFKGVSVTQLDGGLTNRSFRLERGGEAYVLRLDAAHTGAFPLDRNREVAIMRRAHSAGLAPEPVFADPGRGVLLCRFVAGRVVEERELRAGGKPEAIAELMRKVHALPASGHAFDPASVAKTYERSLGRDLGRFPFGAKCLDALYATPGPETLCCCHNDIVAENILIAERLILIDWEYACDNDPLFDLASLIGYHDLEESHARALLRAYAGNEDGWHALQRQLRLYDALQWLWLASRQLISYDKRFDGLLDKIERRLTA